MRVKILNSKILNFRMKIKERANLERPNLRVTTIEKEIYIKGQYKCKIYKVLNDCKILKPNRARTANKYLSIYLSIKGQYENRQNCEWCGISNGRTIPKLAHFWNIDNFQN